LDKTRLSQILNLLILLMVFISLGLGQSPTYELFELFGPSNKTRFSQFLNLLILLMVFISLLAISSKVVQRK
jgi:threonine/homoserine efflux transporter RhtA